MSTKAEILKRMENVADDELVAVPTIYTREIAEDLWEYAESEELELTQDQWARIVEDFENCEYPDDEALIESIRTILVADQ
jgi:hypothetical protein